MAEDVKLTQDHDTQAQEPVVVNPDDLRQIVGDLMNDLIPKEDDKRSEPVKQKPSDVQVRDRVQPWERRTILTLNAQAHFVRGNVDHATKLYSRAKEIFVQGGERLAADEDREAYEILTRAGLDGRLARRLMDTLTDASGGALLPKPFLAEIFALVEFEAQARQVFRRATIASKTIEAKGITNKPTAYWADDNDRIASSDLTFSNEVITAKKLAGIAGWSTELEEDDALGLLPVLQQLFAEAIAVKEDAAAFTGDGTATYGGFTGLLNLSGAYTVTMGTGQTTYASVTEADLRSLKNQFPGRVLRGAEWFMHQTVWDVVEQLESTGGQRIVQPAITEASRPRLFGYPVNLIDQMPATSDATQTSKPFIVFGNPKYALFLQRRGVTIEASRDAVLTDGAGAVSVSAFEQDAVLYKLTERVAIHVPSPMHKGFAVLVTAAT